MQATLTAHGMAWALSCAAPGGHWICLSLASTLPCFKLPSWPHPSRPRPGQSKITVGILGPGQGAYGSSTIYVGDQHRRLLLRSAKSVAARFQREHQWSAETVLSQGNRPVGALASLSEQSGTSAQRATTRDLAI